MIIYRIFFGFCGVCLCFLYIYVYGSKACAALHLGHSSCQLRSDTPTGTSSSFFALRKTPFHSRLYWSGVALFHLSRLPFTSLSFSGRGRAALRPLSAVHTVCRYRIFLPSSFVSALPESLAVFLFFYFLFLFFFIKCPYSTETVYRCVQGESPSRLGHFLPTAN